MRKMRKNGYVPQTVILILLIGALLSGCASTSRNGQDMPGYPNVSRPAGAKFVKPPQTMPEDPALHKPLPEMTAQDYEASGDLFMAHEDYAMAFVQYEKSLLVEPGNLRIHYKQGMLFLHTGKPGEAAAAFRDILQKEPRHAGAGEGLGTAYYEMKNYDLAEKHFLAALAVEPALWKSRNYLGNIYDFQEKFAQAAAAYAEAIRLKPDEGMLYNNLGVSLYLAGRYEESIQAFHQALNAKGPKERVYNNMGLVLGKTGRYDAALDAFMKGSDSARAYNNLGCVYLSQGDHRRAAQAFNKAIATSPKFYTLAHENLKKAQLEDSFGQR